MRDPGDEDAAEPATTPDPLLLATTIRRFADGLAMAYGGPVYLVGSGVDRIHLWPGEYGYDHDLDMRCVVSAGRLAELFGPRMGRPGLTPGAHNTQDVAWMRENLKQSRRLSRALQMRVDFQIQIATSRYASNPRIRLDTIPDWMFSAGDGEP